VGGRTFEESTMRFSRVLSLARGAGVVLALLGAGAAHAQTTLLAGSGANNFSIDGGRIYFITASGEFCSLQKARSLSTGGGAVTDLLTISGNCPLTSGVIKADGGFLFTISFPQQIHKLWTGGVSAATTLVSVPPAAAFDLAGDFQTQGDWVYWSSPYAVGRVHRATASSSGPISMCSPPASLPAAHSTRRLFWPSIPRICTGVSPPASSNAPL
jgi:hypothetical protein